MIKHKKDIDVESEEYFSENFADVFIRFIKSLFSFLRPSCKFEEFLEKTGEYFDEQIILEQKRSNLKYVGGKINFTLSGNQVDMQAKLYFQNEVEKWIVQESHNSIDKSRFNDWDTDEDLIKLSKGETIELDINPPE